MVRTWPYLGRRLNVPAHVFSEVALAGILLVALAFTWSDGAGGDGVVDPSARPAAFVQQPSMNFQWIAYAVGGRAQFPLPQPHYPSAKPATILIPSLNVHRPVESVGVDSHGTMEVPQNLWNAGWYEYGPVPGAPGDAVIEGHAGWPNAPLLFGRLGQLHRGDQIVVVLADGSRQLFLVDSMKSWPATAHPAGLFDVGGPPRLTLITCDGTFDDQYKTYSNRLVVETTYAGTA
ncbi:MAG: class F sortase [Candidatus Dormiibacterota bacterium]